MDLCASTPSMTDASTSKGSSTTGSAATRPDALRCSAPRAPGTRHRCSFRDTDAHDVAIEAIVALPATTEVTFAPDFPPECINTWGLVAERGLYAYDCDPNGGPYRLVAAPAVPVRLDALVAVADVAIRLRGLRFEIQSVVIDDMLIA